MCFPGEAMLAFKWTDRPAMTIAVDMGRNKQKSYVVFLVAT